LLDAVLPKREPWANRGVPNRLRAGRRTPLVAAAALIACSVVSEPASGADAPAEGVEVPGTSDAGEYVDRLIEEPLPLADERAEEAPRGWDGLPGFRSLTLGYTGYVRDLDVASTYREHGLNLNYQQETAHYGNVLLDATLGYADAGDETFFRGLNAGTGGLVTLYNTGLPLGGLWVRSADSGSDHAKPMMCWRFNPDHGRFLALAARFSTEKQASKRRVRALRGPVSPSKTGR
jgi:hypothetical protein